MRWTAQILLVLSGICMTAVCFGIEADCVKDLAGTWRVTGENISGELHLPGTLADAKLGRHKTAADWAADGNSKVTSHGDPSKGALTREWQYRGKAVYERKIELSPEEARYPLELVLERVMLHSELAIDGETVGSRDSLAVEHVYSIPQRLTKPGLHTIRLTLDNSNRYGFSEWAHSYGPVMQSVWHGVVGQIALRRQSPLRQTRVFAPWPANEKLTVEVPDSFDATDGNISISSLAASVAALKPSPYRKDFKLVELKLDREPEPWSEHHPNLYTLTLRDEANAFTHTIRFGFRSIAAHDHALWINGFKWFMRGNLDCCHFPLTGAPDTTKAWWRETFRKLRDEDGINAIRFHSWTPPKAAFDAADEMGMYCIVEAGIWQDKWMHSDLIGHGKPIDSFTQAELRTILERRGNSPSFISLGIGNELGGSDFMAMGKWMDDCRAFDPGRLYIATTARGTSPGDDYVSTHRQKDVGMVRERLFTGTDWDYEDVYGRIALPTVAHEIGQWPIYVDWDHELPKYTGVLRPYNLEHYRDIAEKSGTRRFWPRFRVASAKLNRLMYKDEVESFMRTPSCAGLQLLSAQDFTGQFEAMIGWRDSFYDLKPAVKEFAPFRDIFNELPHLARFGKYCWWVGETYKATLVLRNITEKPIAAGTEFKWSVVDNSRVKVKHVERVESIAPGEVGIVGKVSLPLTDEMAGKKFLLTFGRNSWPFWVFKNSRAERVDRAEVVETASFDDAVAALERGGRVLYIGRSAKCAKSHFKPVYWSAGHFKQANAELSSLGYWVDAVHPALHGFTTEDWADWQWYNLVEGGVKHGISDLPDGFEAIVIPVPDLHYSTPMGMLFELKAGRGRLMVCGLNLSDRTKPEVCAMRDSIRSYMLSDDFNPAVSVEIGKFRDAFEPLASESRKRPPEFADAPVYIAAAVELDVANKSVPWKPSLDMAEMKQGTYKVSGKRVWGAWHDSTGSFWHGKNITVTLTGLMPVTGKIHVRFRDPNQNNRSGRGKCEGRSFEIPKHQDAKDGVFWAKLPVMREDFLDGKIEVSCEALTGPNLMIDRVILTEDM